jgi:hypothetical protein
MKRNIVFLLVGIAILFSSCMKSYSCTCTGPIYATTAPAEVKSDLGKMSKYDAEAACANFGLDKSYTLCYIK